MAEALFTRDMVALQEWWIWEIRALTKKVMEQEARRQARERNHAERLMGDDFRTYTDIQDAYGMGIISERKRDRLMEILESANPEPDRLYGMKLDLLSELYQTAQQVIRDQQYGGAEE